MPPCLYSSVHSGARSSLHSFSLCFCKSQTQWCSSSTMHSSRSLSFPRCQLCLRAAPTCVPKPFSDMSSSERPQGSCIDFLQYYQNSSGKNDHLPPLTCMQPLFSVLPLPSTHPRPNSAGTTITTITPGFPAEG